jgi:hypothetical protein
MDNLRLDLGVEEIRFLRFRFFGIYGIGRILMALRTGPQPWRRIKFAGLTSRVSTRKSAKTNSTTRQSFDRDKSSHWDGGAESTPAPSD